MCLMFLRVLSALIWEVCQRCMVFVTIFLGPFQFSFSTRSTSSEKAPVATLWRHRDKKGPLLKYSTSWSFLVYNSWVACLQIARGLCSAYTVNLLSFCMLLYLCKDTIPRDSPTLKMLIFWACPDVPRCLWFCTCLFHKSSLNK